MKVNQIMTKDVECISPETSLQEAASRMKSRNVGFLPVCDKDRPVGAITDRDLTIRAIAQGQDAKQTKVKDVMTKDVFFCFEDQEAEECARYMSEKEVRRMLILNRDNKLVGVISLGDLAQAKIDQRIAAETLRHISEAA
jgi:CBS domain-containing protein